MPHPDFVSPLDERLPSLASLAPLGAGPPNLDEVAIFERFNGPVDGYEPPTVTTDDLEIDGPHGPIPVRVYRPAAEAQRGFVWLHGGAFIFGDLEMGESDLVARELAARADAVVVTVDYRLCHGGVHFPVPHDDCHAAYRWAESAGLVPDDAAWAVGGGSAGGCLAAGVAQRLRDEGTPTAAQVLVYPVLHDPIPAGDADLLERVDALPPVMRFPAEATAFLNRNYLGEHAADVAYAFPGLGDIADLPPTLITVAEYDDLRPSGERYAEQIAEAGGSVEVEFVANSPHGYIGIGGLSTAIASIERITAFLQRHA